MNLVTSFNSYQHLFIRKWTALHDIFLREQPSNSDDRATPQIINQDILENAFNGLFASFFRAATHHFSQIEKKRFAHHIMAEESITAVPDFYSHLDITEESIKNTSEAKLGKQQRELNSLVKTHHEEWTSFLENAQNTIIAALERQGITIVDSEIAEFRLLETRSALRNRLIELQLECFKENEALTVKNYLYHKTIIAIRNAFYRQQQLEEITQIKKYLKKLKGTFSELETDENALLAAQKDAMISISLEG